MEKTSTRMCPHCKGTGKCKVCNGTGFPVHQPGKRCDSCFPKGSGQCQNCRGLGGLDQLNHPAEWKTA